MLDAPPKPHFLLLRWVLSFPFLLPVPRAEVLDIPHRGATPPLLLPLVPILVLMIDPHIADKYREGAERYAPDVPPALGAQHY